MLCWEDYVPADDGEKGDVWLDVRLRVLVGRDELDRLGMVRAVLAEGDDGPWAVDPCMFAQIGEPAECPECGAVAVRYGDEYPFGKKRHGWSKNVVEGQYCPHCDGAEDAG